MRVDIFTLFPGMFDGFLKESILKIAQNKKKIRVRTHDIRRWTPDKHRTADDKPYGGGSGMVMKAEPIYKGLESILGKKTLQNIRAKKRIKAGLKVILLAPDGKKFEQKTAKKLSRSKHIVFICGHYEGIDERVGAFATDRISIGDYILTGGEMAAAVILDAVTRLIPGVLGDSASLRCESFEKNLLEYPQYTRPREFEGMEVPRVLLSGAHGEIEKWREKEALRRTKILRNDLINKGK